MGYYRHEVPGGEFVIEGDRHWRITFNGVQIGGLYPRVDEAIAAVDRRRARRVAGPDLTGVPNPPPELTLWRQGPGVDPPGP